MTASLLIRPGGERLRDALAREELAGYRYVLYGWLFSLSVVSLYLLATIPLSRTVYYLGIILVFAAVGLAWGEGRYPRAHGVQMAPDDTMFLTDDERQLVGPAKPMR